MFKVTIHREIGTEVTTTNLRARDEAHLERIQTRVRAAAPAGSVVQIKAKRIK